ncbi:c-type cytochrome [Cyanobium sp. Alchichica 3B3-8F6]|uniref:c-type cytochrome n=1 Tax=Cyanobium sp. Alchichica 3B3-8F6 TaxID=2823696 RepID=UPI0020CC9643|nr:c-type cytochrome [Cyanobium sp. Alchichica 3B3-8F6]MCP9883243.1 c-type cytochrome [Cyanobium sp. Alchichica 3B3-8F6]
MDVVVQSSWDGSAWWRTVLRGVLPVLLMALLLAGAAPAWADLAGPDGGQLFANHCAGCHVNGGNIIRRGKTLRLAALERNGIHDAQRIAAIAAVGLGQMSGYGAVLGDGGPEAVADYVWQQAQLDWPRA